MHYHKHKDITGQRFGKLTALSHLRTIKKSTPKNGIYYITEWLLRCDCGELVTKTKTNLSARTTPSCAACCKFSMKQINKEAWRERTLKRIASLEKLQSK